MAGFMNMMKKSAGTSPAKTTEEIQKKTVPTFLTIKSGESKSKEEQQKEVVEKKESGVKQQIVKPAKEETIEAKIEEDSVKETENQEEQVASEEESKEVTVEEDSKEVAVEEEKEEAVVEEEKEEAKQKVVEEQPKKKRTRRKKAEIEADKANQVSESNEETDSESIVENYSDSDHITDYETAVNAISSQIVDPEWEELKQDLAESVNAINITADINVAGVKNALADLNSVYQKAWYEFQAVKTKYNELAGKEPDGLIRQIKRLNGTGNNAESRERAGILACKNYKPNGSDEVVDLYSLFSIVSERYIFLEAVINNIEFKRNLLITMNGLLKLENDLL